MLVDNSLLRHAQEWISVHQPVAHENGVSTEVTISPRGREIQSIWWILESERRMGEIILWETGNAELGFVMIESGEVRPEHRVIDGTPALEEALKAVLDWVVEVS